MSLMHPKKSGIVDTIYDVPALQLSPRHTVTSPTCRFVWNAAWTLNMVATPSAVRPGVIDAQEPRLDRLGQLLISALQPALLAAS